VLVLCPPQGEKGPGGPPPGAGGPSFFRITGPGPVQRGGGGGGGEVRGGDGGMVSFGVKGGDIF